MLTIGSHLSSAKGFESMGIDALKIGANTFQFFTRNPQGGRAKDIDISDVQKFLELSKTHGFQKFLAHAPYTLNPCSDNPQTREFALMVFSDDLKRMEFVPHNYYNFHPGSHVGQGIENGIEMISDLLNQVLTKEQTTTVLLETMSGKGSEIGSKFEELRAIIDRTNLNEKLGVCLDTCHVYSASYDIVRNLDGVLEEFDCTIGLNRLKAIHLNDSKTEFASHKDRHEQIGKGSIGFEAIVRLVNHKSLKHLPFILETPNDLAGWADEITLLRQNFNT
ncbi:MAG: deoxyribonuclease IV [Alphaproteobacteria bacterium]|nr:deoxyribonuclease IV [Alphaproteobacteria bacterium]